MTLLEAIILGIIQGLTEFLPVSSSGHLELGKAILGETPEEGMLMTVVLHFATALSTIVIFRKDIAEIFRGLFKFKNNSELRFSLMIIISMIPAAMVGMLFEDEIDAFFSGNILLVGAMLILTGALLFLADKAKSTDGKVTPMKAVVIGIAQAIAILPGISRSGATIGTSVLLGVDKMRAARFSFLMVVPLIFGAMAVKAKKYIEISELEKTSVELRVADIMVDLEEDLPVDQLNAASVKKAIQQKEYAWQAIKESKPDALSINEIDTGFQQDLKSAGLSDDQINTVVSNDLAKVRPVTGASMSTLFVGFLAAFLTGLLACTWMIKLVKRSKLKYFSYYCFAVGVLAMVWSLIP